MEKQRVTYAAFAAQQSKNRPGTVAWCIEKYIAEMSQEGMRGIGLSQLYSLRVLQRSPAIGPKLATELKPADWLEHGRLRRSNAIPTFIKRAEKLKEVSAATVSKDFTGLSVMLKYAADVWEIDVDLEQIGKAKREARRQGLIATANVRKRRPTLEELERQMDLFEKQDARPRTKIKMAPLQAAAIVTTRRLGELCRIPRSDVNWTKGTYWVRDMKHSKRKKGNDKEFALLPEFAEIIKRQPWKDPSNPHELIFPFNPKSASARGTLARKKLGIVGLRFHDNRREGISRWLKKLPPVKVRQYVSGHDTTLILERNYDAPRAEDLVIEMGADLVQPVPRAELRIAA